MIPVPSAVLRRLDLQGAIQAEAQSWQSLLPPAPGWDHAVEHVTALARWMSGQLATGMSTTNAVNVSVRKVPYGIRPVPIWGYAERIAYRALVDFILRNEPPLDRSAEAYLKFLGSPVTYAQEIEPRTRRRFRTLFSSVIHYVVKADITAFYEYVDHGILARELLTRTGDSDAIDCLISLLAAVQGRSFGLPQLFDSSDRLSEVYIDIVERDLLRRGWPAWRFNDDFRIAARDFGNALDAIEDLSDAARQAGLTLSDSKTTTPRYDKYLLDNFGLTVENEAPDELRRLQPEEAVGDYTEGVGETDPAWAVDVISSTQVPGGQTDAEHVEGINLANVHGDEFRKLRRALGRLIRAETADALPHVLKLAAYVPSLTPWTIRYVVAAGQQQREPAIEVMDEIVRAISLSDWRVCG